MTVGAKRTFSVTDWVGFKVTGNVAPGIVKSVPLRVSEVMVTGDVPVEVNVTGSIVGVFNVTSVSYTHLDVYKRQGPNKSQNCRAFRFEPTHRQELSVPGI